MLWKYSYEVMFVCKFDFIFFVLPVPTFSWWILWSCFPKSPKPSPASPASRHHPNQRASAAGLCTGRAPKAKTLPRVVQHHPQCLFQEVTPPIHIFFPPLCAHSECIPNRPEDLRTLYFCVCVFVCVYFPACKCTVNFCDHDSCLSRCVFQIVSVCCSC